MIPCNQTQNQVPGEFHHPQRNRAESAEGRAAPGGGSGSVKPPEQASSAELRSIHLYMEIMQCSETGARAVFAHMVVAPACL
jgi:hypothetical protein